MRLILIFGLPRVGFEPTRDYSQRIISPIRATHLVLLRGYQIVFIDVSAVNASYVIVNLST